jgi:hypothetical protein
MKENSAVNLSLSRETATFLLDLSRRTETPAGDEKMSALHDVIEAAINTQQEHPIEAAKEEARTNLAQVIKDLAQAQDELAESFAQGNESGQRTASAIISAGEVRLRVSQAAYDAAAGKVLEAKAESAERTRQAAYENSKKAHDEALAALRRYEPMAQEMSKLFQVLSYHTDLALADTEAADEARISPHAANVADHLHKVLQEQKAGHSEAITKHVLAALHELKLAAHVRS